MNLLLALLLACAQEPKKEPPVLASELLPAYGASPELTWKSYVLTLENLTGGELDLEAVVGYESGGSRALQKVKLAARAKKRLFFYLPFSYSGGQLSAEIKNDAGKVVGAPRISETWRSRSGSGSQNIVFALALMDKPPSLAPADMEILRCPEEFLPDRWIGFDGLKVVFMRDYRLDQCLPAQRAALLEWVQRGGLMVICPGSSREWLNSPGVQAFAPVLIGDSGERLGFPSLERRHGEFRDESKFLYHAIKNGDPISADRPVEAVQFRRGAGTVIVLPFDFERRPFDTWPGAPDFRSELLAASHARVTTLGDETDAFVSASTADVNTLPPFLLLFMLATAFIVVVGPVNYAVLKRLRMTMLLVVTVPAISAAFLGIVIGVGYILRGTSTVTREVVLLHTGAGDDVAGENHLITVFSPGARTYDLSWKGTEVGSLATEPQDYRFSHSYREDTADLLFDQSDGWTIKEIAFTQWQARTFRGRCARPLGGSVTFALEGDSLRISNGTSFTLRRGWLVTTGPSYLPFDKVPAGSDRVFKGRATHNLPAFSNGDLEGRVLTQLFRSTFGRSPARPQLLCVLDRLPDEVGINSGRSSASDRTCLLQVDR